MKTRTDDREYRGLVTDLLAGASILRKEAARLAKDADCLHETIDRMHAAADRLHRRIEQTHIRIRTYRSLNRIRKSPARRGSGCQQS